jgi:hypothetical protein
MLAALIASQTLVALVSAAPTPKEDFVVNLGNDFVNQHLGNEAFLKGKCLIAKDPKNECTDALTLKEAKDALDFLGKHDKCDALTTKLKMKFNVGEEKFDKVPMEAYCYVRAKKECGKLTKANFPNYKKITLAKSVCSGSSKPSKTAFAHEKPVAREEGKFDLEALRIASEIFNPRRRNIVIQNQDGTKTKSVIMMPGSSKTGKGEKPVAREEGKFDLEALRKASEIFNPPRQNVMLRNQDGTLTQGVILRLDLDGNTEIQTLDGKIIRGIISGATIQQRDE